MKSFSIVLLFCAALLLFQGCGGNNTTRDIDLELISSELLASSAFTDRLALLDPDIGYGLYSIDAADCKRALFYLSSGATAEELALFEAENSQAAEKIKTAIERRIKYQTDSFRNYVPGEVSKLDDCIVFERGNYVILCVASEYSDVNEIFGSIR